MDSFGTSMSGIWYCGGNSGSGTWFFVVWLGLAVVFALFAIAVKMNLWVRLPGIIRKIFLAVICLGLAFFVVVEGCIISKFHEKGQADLDYIIVLGAQVHGIAKCSIEISVGRAIAYLEENAGTFCIVSGGQGYNEPFPEAEGMAAYLKEHGVSSERILLETESQTTSQNISNSMAYLQEDASVGIVTNDFHMFRALQTAKSQGLQKVCGISAGSVKRYLMNVRICSGNFRRDKVPDFGSWEYTGERRIQKWGFLAS
ncbi:MAG: YdcF family protein [Eubacterium sp.]